jgi:hypothetical protein
VGEVKKHGKMAKVKALMMMSKGRNRRKEGGGRRKDEELQNGQLRTFEFFEILPHPFPFS